MKNLYMLLPKKNDPKAPQPNKITSSETQNNKNVVISDDQVQ